MFQAMRPVFNKTHLIFLMRIVDPFYESKKNEIGVFKKALDPGFNPSDQH